MTSTPPTTTPIASQATAREFLTILFRRKWLILGLFAATTITVLAMTLTAPMTYVSSGRLLIKRGHAESVFLPYRVSSGTWEEDLGSELEVIKSYPVVQRAIEMIRAETPPGTRPPEVHVEQAAVEVLGKSTAILVSYQDRSPAVAQQVCDAIIHAYIEYRQSLVALPFPKAFFDTQIHAIESDLEQKVELRRRFLTREGMTEAGYTSRSTLDYLGVLDQRRTATHASLVEAQAEVRLMRELREHPGIDMPILNTGDALVDLKRKIINQQARIAELRERYRDEAPEVAAAQTTLDTLRAMLRGEVDAGLVVAQTKVQSLQARLAEEERDAAQTRGQLGLMPSAERTVTDLDRDIKLLTDRRSELVANRDRALVNENTTPNINVILLDPAEKAVQRNPRDKVRLALAPAFSLLIGIGLAFFIDGLDLTVRTSGQAEQALELPVLASLPDQRRRRAAGAGETSDS